MGRRGTPWNREVFVNLYHSVALCRIFLVIVKLGGFSQVIEWRPDGKGEQLSIREFFAILCHFGPFCAISS